jgi:hypothetical protein
MHYLFKDTLTARDGKRHIQHTFVVPAHSQALDLLFSFAPARVQGIENMLTLTLFDPAGFRGAGHRGGAEHRVRIDAGEATPGYLPGPLPAGTWTAEIDTHMIMPGPPLRYRLEVDVAQESAGTGIITGTRPYATGDASHAGTGACTCTGTRPYATGDRAQGAESRAGWYRGDLHTHTHHSDAAGCSVADLVRAARDEGLDFIFITDHNTHAGLAEGAALGGAHLLVAAGIELTTFWGHALCLGTHEWVDWRVRPGTGDMARIAAATYERGHAFVIAHPQAVGDPACTGCNWRFGEMMPGNARLVEVWNGPWGCDSNNEQALALWYDWLNQGRRLVATAGSDTHSSADYAARPGFNVVYAEALSEAALLRALQAGHLVLSAGPQLTLQAQDAAGGRWMAGDLVGDMAGGRVAITAAWAGCPAGAQVRTVVHGRLLEQRPAGERGTLTWEMTPDQAGWIAVEVRSRDGDLLALTNPLFMPGDREWHF